MDSQEFLEKTIVKTLIEEDPNFNLVSISATTPVIEILKTLGTHKISAVPVVDEKANAVIGCVDVLDLLCFACEELDEVDPPKVGLKIREFASRNAGDILNFSGRNPWNDLSYKARFTEVLDLLCKNAHRVAITNEQIDIVGLLTQSRVIRFFKEHKEIFRDRLSKTVGQVWGDKKVVHSVALNSFVIDALRKMREAKVSGLAIVDDHGALVGNISAGDLRNVDYNDLGGLREDLHSQIRSFKNLVSSPTTLSTLAHFDPVIITLHSTLEDVIDLLLKNKIHRVFIVDEQKKPTHVVSIGDLIKALKDK